MRTLAAALLALALPGCASLPWSAASRHCPVELVPAGALPALRLQQRLRFAESEGGIDAVAEVRDGGLVLVGLTPAGTRAFHVQQRGTELEVERGVARWLGVEPLEALDALHRARLIGWGEQAEGDGEVPAVHGRELRVDTWRGGLRVARTFAEPGEDPAVRIEYGFDDDGVDDVPRRITIENDWCGYRAVIATLAEEPLP